MGALAEWSPHISLLAALGVKAVTCWFFVKLWGWLLRA